jgi:hypothetical protein
MQSLRTGLSPVPLNDTFHTIASSDIFTSFFADNGRSIADLIKNGETKSFEEYQHKKKNSYN